MTTKTADLRGAALARAVIEQIKEEVRTVENLEAEGRNPSYFGSRVRPDVVTWDQGVWGLVDPAVATGTATLEVIEYDSEGDYVEVAFPEPTCGTAMCAAGHAVVMTGGRLVADVSEWITSEGFASVIDRGEGAQLSVRSFDFERGDRVDVDDVVFIDEQGERQRQRIRTRAAELLGLTEAEAEEFFSARNDLTTLERYVGRMERGENIINGLPKRTTDIEENDR
ncbi:hypothetical protein SEA_EVAA_77 [Gordonia phage Evaa]|nr:hypothetical protein SEA_EVAA_77 [Gordonia phage Evaa]